jgi:hypothetical protein
MSWYKQSKANSHTDYAAYKEEKSLKKKVDGSWCCCQTSLANILRGRMSKFESELLMQMGSSHPVSI